MVGNPGDDSTSYRTDTHPEKYEYEKGPDNNQPEGKEVHLHRRAIIKRKHHDHDGERYSYKPVEKFHIHLFGSVGGPDRGEATFQSARKEFNLKGERRSRRPSALSCR